MISLNGVEVVPTIFPDKTSQVWKIKIPNEPVLTIQWKFEHEAEFMHVAQLKQLIDTEAPQSLKVLDLPFLPYARQDKNISTENTFALHTFAALLNSLSFDKVVVFDPHSKITGDRHNSPLIMRAFAVQPMNEIRDSFACVDADCVVFPDAGANNRYAPILALPTMTAFKKRNQATGEIESIVLDSIDGAMKKDTVLIVDDICDGGRTFTELAKHLKAAGVKNIHLYVSHGIFSKGKEVLRAAGIQRIFTKDGEC